MEPTTATNGTRRLGRRLGLALLVSVLAGCANCPIKLPGAPVPAASAPPPAPDAWFRNLSRIDPASLFDGNGRVRHPLPEGVDFFCMQDEDVAVVPVPGAVATWGDVSLARDGDAMRPGMVNTRTVGHHSLDRLREDGIFVGDTEAESQQTALAEMMRVSPRGVGVPAFIPVVGQNSDDWPAVVVTPEVIVRFRQTVLENAPGATPRERAELIAAGWGADVVEVSPVDSATYVLRVRGLDPGNWLRVAREMQTSPATDGLAHPNLMVHRERSLDNSGDASSNTPPPPLDDPLLPRQWHLQQIGAIEAWTRQDGQNPLGDPSVVVAILDPNGVEVTHEDLIQNAEGHAHWNFDTKTSDPQMRKTVDDGHYNTSEHGTAAAGLAVGRGGNGIGISGVAPNCGLMGVCLGPTIRDDVWAIDHAWKNGAAVISNSWSYDVGVNVPDALRCAIARARALGRDGKGCVVLFSLTNENKNNFAGRRGDGFQGTTCDIAGAEPRMVGWSPPAEAAGNVLEGVHTGWRPIASSPGVMSIGRATNNGVWGNCGFGPGMSLLGPGQSTLATPTKECSWDPNAVRGDADIVTCDLSDANGEHAGYNWGTPPGEKPSGCACRLMALRGSSEDDTALEVNDGNYTACFKGTSAAVPIVAGAAALVISENPELTGDEVREILEITAQPIERAGGDYVWDELRRRWYSPTRGHGLVDALAAVEEARRRRLDKIPRLELVKTAPAEAYAKRPFSFTMTVRNAGKVPADDVTVIDELPAGLEFAGASAGGLQEDDGRILFGLGTLLPGAERTITITCVAPEAGSVTNTATAAAVGATPAGAEIRLDVLPPPTLEVDVAGPDASYVGSAVEWVVTVTNASPDAARGVRITCDVPDGLSAPDAQRLAAGPHPGVVEGSRIVWHLAELAPSAVADVTFALMPLRAGTSVTSGAVTANGADPVTFERELTVQDIPASLSLQVGDVSDPILLGDEVIYLINVRNQSTTAARDIQIEATLAPEQEFVSAQSADGSPHAIADGVVRFEPLETLAGGARAVYRVIVKASSAGDVRFGVRLTSSSLSSPVEETESTQQR